MTMSYRILQTAGEPRIAFEGHAFAADELHEAIWLHTIEIRGGLSKREMKESKRQIAQFEALLSALRSAGG